MSRSREEIQTIKDLGLWPLLYCNQKPVKFGDLKEPTREEAQAMLDKFFDGFNKMGVVPKSPPTQGEKET